MTRSLPLPRSPRARLTAGVLAVLVLAAGVAWASTRSSTGTAAAPPQVIPAPVVAPVGLVRGEVPWDAPLKVTVVDGTLRAVSALDPDGRPMEGALSDGEWRSSGTLLPGSTYRLRAVVVDGRDRARTVALEVATKAADKVLRAVVSPGDGKVVGVGLPVIVTLNRAVTSTADRAAVVARLRVVAVPPVAGAWRWMSPTELHYRGPDYWAAHSTIHARADLRRLHLSDDTWGEGLRDSTYEIGNKVVATVDVAAKMMTVERDGVLLRTVKVSTGRDKYPTKGGVHLVLEKTKLKVMDSATVGIPRDSPDGYYEKVPDSVRISYGGAFVHSADWSVRDQGVRNVSHGCVNISPADAAWFFDLVKRGDVVDITHANAPPKLSDPGMSDWNIPFAQWAN